MQKTSVVQTPCPRDAGADLRQRLVRGDGWTPWQALEKCWQGQRIPTTPGLYRVGVVLVRGETQVYREVIYIGQSSNVRERLGCWPRYFVTTMPFKTPHVAGPFLWALRHRTHLEHIPLAFEVSVFALEKDLVPQELRLGYEALGIALYRQTYRRSPAANYSRLLCGYVASTYNTGPENSYRGVPSPRREKSHLPSLAPVGPLSGAPTDQAWCGHEWSEWTVTSSVALPKEHVGLYRLRSVEKRDVTLLYVGSGKLRDRLKPYRQQTAIECSWTCKQPCEQGYQEYVDDAIAAHVLATRTIPTWQFAKDALKRPPSGYGRVRLER